MISSLLKLILWFLIRNVNKLLYLLSFLTYKIKIIEDYKVFFNEKEADNLSIEEIIAELGKPYEIVQELVKDKVYEINLFQKISSMEKIRLLLVGLWIATGIIFLVIIQTFVWFN